MKKSGVLIAASGNLASHYHAQIRSMDLLRQVEIFHAYDLSSVPKLFLAFRPAVVVLQYSLFYEHLLAFENYIKATKQFSRPHGVKIAALVNDKKLVEILEPTRCDEVIYGVSSLPDKVYDLMVKQGSIEDQRQRSMTTNN